MAKSVVNKLWKALDLLDADPGVATDERRKYCPTVANDYNKPWMLRMKFTIAFN